MKGTNCLSGTLLLLLSVTCWVSCVCALKQPFNLHVCVRGSKIIICVCVHLNNTFTLYRPYDCFSIMLNVAMSAKLVGFLGAKIITHYVAVLTQDGKWIRVQKDLIACDVFGLAHTFADTGEQRDSRYNSTRS